MKMRPFISVLLPVFILAGCSPLSSRSAPRGPAVYLLTASAPAQVAPAEATCHVLMVNSPRAAPGYGTAAMVYTRGQGRLESYAYHRWADSPARMLYPELVSAGERSGAFKAVVTPSAPVRASVRLDTELNVLRQAFTGKQSEVQLSLRVRLFAGDRLLGTRVFDFAEPAGQGAESGVEATQIVVSRALGDVMNYVQTVIAEKRPTCIAEG